MHRRKPRLTLSTSSPDLRHVAPSSPVQDGRTDTWPGYRALGPVLMLACVVTIARIVYLFVFCPYSLVEDEAQYWEWSRRLGLSYYSKGPGVAWLIWAATSILGTSEGAIRVGAALSGGITALAVGGLAMDATGDRRAGLPAAACVLLAPIFQISSLLMTIDAPYVACWAVACWAGWRALRHGSSAAWIVLGAAVGAGFLFKYTMLLLLPGLLGFAVYDRLRRGGGDERRDMHLLAKAAAAVLALLGLAPVVVWNVGHEWVTVRHLLGHLGVAGGDTGPRSGGWRFEPMWTVEFLGSQVALIGPVLLLMAYGAWSAIRARRENVAQWRGQAFLLWCAAPILLFYLGLTFVSEGEGNWPMAGYVTLLAMAGWLVGMHMPGHHARVAAWRAMPTPRPKQGWFRRQPESHTQIAWHATLVVGVLVAAASLRLDWAAVPINAAYRWMTSSTASKTATNNQGGSREGGENRLDSSPTSARRRVLLPIHRLTGGPQLGAEAHALAVRLRESTGLEPFHIAQHYGRASLLAFYLPGRPIVYCASSRLGGRATQWDHWPDTNLDNLEILGGRPAVLSGAELEQWQAAFDRVEDLGVLPSEPKADRRTFLGYGYRGFPKPSGGSR